MIIFNVFGTYVGMCHQTLTYRTGRTRMEVIRALFRDVSVANATDKIYES